MRKEFFNWLSTESKQYKYEPAFLFFTFNIIDRYFGCDNIEEFYTQFIGYAAFSIAEQYCYNKISLIHSDDQTKKAIIEVLYFFLFYQAE